MHAHYNAYRKTLNHTGASRHRDASELARVTVALLHAETLSERQQAIEETRQIWTRCGVNACHDETAMPDEIRRTMRDLAADMILACAKAAAGDIGSLRALIDVNQSVVSGLNPAMPRSFVGNAFHPRVRQVA
ncbi:flagellar biosynthesis regulator FlaF [Thalassobaculum sp. OXR-137]|uniref:flagellar biosynthesis regulator FlaF n=1 Tax=Thalassobaculum sp. OXR-137 TaxID=3100173 RepID=UPI002AC9142D|nr:flagellar biosynthesis regulator FlaF [Thalassobaculum sp. OXR-137]WPZ35936.1 flagellar biosynthesis regulator FlaF [Thalassobaculum sp. OXR-137]